MAIEHPSLPTSDETEMKRIAQAVTPKAREVRPKPVPVGSITTPWKQINNPGSLPLPDSTRSSGGRSPF